MIYRNMGRTGLKVSAFRLGTNTFGRTTDQEQSNAVLDARAAAASASDRSPPRAFGAAAPGARAPP